MATSVDSLRRRPPGSKVVVYLDQSTLSSLALDESYRGLREFLRHQLETGAIVCPHSQEHHEESVAADQSTWEKVSEVGEDLSDGIDFRSGEEIEWAEIHAAAAAFSGEDSDDVWREAFRTDPHTPRDELYTEICGGHVRVAVRFEPDALDRAEVARIKEIEEIAQSDYERMRKDGLSFAAAAELFFNEMVDRDLGPLFAPTKFRAELQRRAQEFAAAAEAGKFDFIARSPYSRYQAYYVLLRKTESLVRRYPAIRKRPAEFRSSGELAHVSSLRFPALLRAALATHRKRNAKPGDGYDIDHMTRGLSRCDVVTADAGMAQVVEQHQLVPAGCTVVRTADQEALKRVIEMRVAAPLE